MIFCYRLGLTIGLLLLGACAAERDHFGSKRATAEVQTTGRALRSAAGWQVTWPAVAWRTAFAGTSIGIDTEDRAGYHVEIDGQVMAPVPAKAIRQTTWYRGLSPGAHTIEIIRMGPTPRAPGNFYGFEVGRDGRWLSLHQSPTRQLMLIGDSGATGYGDLSPSVNCPDDVLPLTDASQSFGVLAARALHADWQLNAMNGIGLVRNWHGIWPGTDFGTYAGRTLQSDPTSIDSDAHWHPQVAIVSIGFNDLATPLESSEPWTDLTLRLAFINAVRSLLAGLRQELGAQALIIVMTDPVSNNPGNELIETQIETRRAGGDQRILALPMPGLEHTSCNYHPSLADHRRLSALLVKIIVDHDGFSNTGSLPP